LSCAIDTDKETKITFFIQFTLLLSVAISWLSSWCAWSGLFLTRWLIVKVHFSIKELRTVDILVSWNEKGSQ